MHELSLRAGLPLFLLVGLAPACLRAQAPSRAACRAAAEISEKGQGLAFLVLHDGKILFEQYSDDWNARRAMHVYSGTKSFAPIVAIRLEEMGLLDLDERVADTIQEWRADRRKARITVRQLLDFTHGLARTREGRAVMGAGDFYGAAIRARARREPGTRWGYGSSSLHVFGELVNRKLRAHAREHPDTATDIVAFLKKEVLEPIGCEVPRWIRDRKEQAALAFGASMTARSWARFGQLIAQGGRWNGRQLLPAKSLARCFEGTEPKYNYGLNWWLLGKSMSKRSPEIPEDTVAALGLFGQVLVVIPSRKLVVVRFGRTGGPTNLDNRRFLKTLLSAGEPRRAKL